MTKKALLLLSGGFDSAVAYNLLKDNLDIIAIHFDSSKLTGDDALKKVKILQKKLKIKKLIIAPFTNVQVETSKKTEHSLFYVITRRIMYKIAESIAKKENCDFLITGENLAQVSSQTLPNMSIITKSLKMEILRPLLCNDKIEIINISKKIKTYDICSGPELCSILGPKHPVTKANLSIIEQQETNLNINKLIKESVDNIF